MCQFATIDGTSTISHFVAKVFVNGFLHLIITMEQFFDQLVSIDHLGTIFLEIIQSR